MTIDILPTVAEMTRAALPEHPVDGRSILPLMTGDGSRKSPHDVLAFYWGNQLHAVRSGKWKLHFSHDYRTLNGRTGGKDGIPVKYDNAQIEQCLFDLETDPGESKNVAHENPDVVADLSAMAEKIRADLGDGARKGSGVRPAGRLAEQN